MASDSAIAVVHSVPDELEHLAKFLGEARRPRGPRGGTRRRWTCRKNPGPGSGGESTIPIVMIETPAAKDEEAQGRLSPCEATSRIEVTSA